MWSWVRFVGCVVGLALVVIASAEPRCAQAEATTTTTEYEYNGDGALVRVTRTEAGSESEETYLVWDNFLPGTGDPTQGTLAAGNGNLLGTGPSPTSLESTYGYDLRNRLVEQEGPGPSVTYGYDAASLLSTATSGSETYRFVYDESANARVTNIEAETADVVLRRMGPVCSLTDGTERMLVRPDKDVAGVYDRSAETFTAYEYDPYGGTEESGGTKLDLHENPFQYAGEYRDPIWGGYYLRARWYAPELPTFLTRDPAANLSRYGYGDGNPRNRVDPSGRSSKWWKRWNKGGAKFMQEVTGGGARGVVERVFAGGILMPMGIVANPKAFWQSVARGSAATTVVNDLMLAVGMVGEVVMDGPMSGGSGYRADFLRRIAFDAAFGLAQSAASSSSHGFRRFNEKAFFQGLEFAAGGILDARLVGSSGYRPFDKSWQDVKGAQEGEVEVYRFRRRLFGRMPRLFGPLESANLAVWHEGVLFAVRDGAGGVRMVSSEVVGAHDSLVRATLDRVFYEVARPELQFRYEGRISKSAYEEVHERNPLNVQTLRWEGGREPVADEDSVADPNHYRLLWRNCQTHASLLLGEVRAHRSFVPPR